MSSSSVPTYDPRSYAPRPPMYAQPPVYAQTPRYATRKTGHPVLWAVIAMLVVALILLGGFYWYYCYYRLNKVVSEFCATANCSTCSQTLQNAVNTHNPIKRFKAARAVYKAYDQCQQASGCQCMSGLPDNS